jgi:hypothetical protein
MIVTRYIDVLSHIKHVTFGVQTYIHTQFFFAKKRYTFFKKYMKSQQEMYGRDCLLNRLNIIHITYKDLS